MRANVIDAFLVEDANLTSSLLLEEGKTFDESRKSAVGGHRDSLLSTARNTAVATVFLLLSEAVGTGVFSLPGAASHLGWTLSIVSLVLFAFAAFYSSVLLAEVKLVHPEVRSYADAAHVLCGRWFGYFTQGCILLSWAFELVYYLIVIADSVALITDGYPGVVQHQWQKTIIAAALIVIPVQCRDYHAISYYAIPSTIAVVVAVVIVLMDIGSQGLQYGEKTSAAPVAGSDFVSQFQALANIIFAYNSQSIFFQIMSEMKESTTFTRVTALAYGVMMGFYAITVVVAYGYQGTDVSSFLPMGMSKGPSKTATSILLVFHIVIVYVMKAQPFTHIMHSKVFPKTLDKRTFGGAMHWAIISLSHLAISYVFANAIPFFSEVQGLIGAMFGAPIVFGWPALFYSTMCYQAADCSRMGMLKKMGTWHALFCGFFFLVCCPVFCILGVIASSRDLGEAIADRKPPFS